jgi:hypothetical protein
MLTYRYDAVSTRVVPRPAEWLQLDDKGGAGAV